MRYIFIVLLLLSTSIMAQDTKLTIKEQEALKKALQDEQKFAEEQRFYNASEYDFDGAKVNDKAVNSLYEGNIGAEVDAANEDFDMDDVY